MLHPNPNLVDVHLIGETRTESDLADKMNDCKKRLSLALVLTLLLFSTSHAREVQTDTDYADSKVVWEFSTQKPYVYYTNDSYSRRAGNTFPGEPAAYYARVQSARQMVRVDNCEGAVPLLEQATHEYADHGNIWGLLGACLDKLGKWEGAVEAYKEALGLGVQPWDSDLYLPPNDMMVKIAGVYAQASDTENALLWLRRGLESSHHVIASRDFHGPATDIEVRRADCSYHRVSGHAERQQFCRVEEDLVLLDQPAKARHLSHPRHVL